MITLSRKIMYSGLSNNCADGIKCALEQDGIFQKSIKCAGWKIPRATFTFFD